ncbi:MAG TPA: hypothetical protein VD998_02985 [Verrucomicrobiae bacterium]|nr:hypothetical protein [Verrucomicrobiae bacterium]
MSGNLPKINPTIHLSKTDAAKRQIEMAVKLFLRDQDPVSIHTLTSAAYNVLLDLKNKRKIDLVVLKSTSFIKPGKEKEYLAILNQAENFFKHADRDPDELLKFNPELTTYALSDAIRVYYVLTGESTPLMKAFNMWFMLRHTDLVDNPECKQILHEIKTLDVLNVNNKQAFLNILPQLDVI